MASIFVMTVLALILSVCGSIGVPPVLFQTQASREFHCAVQCQSHSACSSYLFHDYTSFVSVTSDYTGNCILLSAADPPEIGWSFPVGFHQWIFTEGSNLTGVRKMVVLEDRASRASKMGFDIRLEVGGGTVFLQRIQDNITVFIAGRECFLVGGILPMEDSEEYIEVMNSFLGNPTNLRFISLAREINPDAAKRDLVWTLGQKEWGDDAPVGSNSKYANWPTSHWNSRYFGVNPVTKMYEPVAWDLRLNNNYCQFLGENLATGKVALARSSTETSSPGLAVDGKIFDGRNWHSLNGMDDKPDWIAVDLGRVYGIKHVLFMARRNCCGDRHKFITAWIGSQAPLPGQDLSYGQFTQCGTHSYEQQTGALNGITCPTHKWGQFVALVNFEWNQPMHVEEIGVFGMSIKT